MAVNAPNNDLTTQIATVQNRINGLDANNPANVAEIERLRGQLKILQNTLQGSRSNGNIQPATANPDRSGETDAGAALINTAKNMLSSVLSLFHTSSADPHAMLPVYTDALETDIQGTNTAMTGKAMTKNPAKAQEGETVVREGLSLMTLHNAERQNQIQKIALDRDGVMGKKGQEAAKPAG